MSAIDTSFQDAGKVDWTQDGTNDPNSYMVKLVKSMTSVNKIVIEMLPRNEVDSIFGEVFDTFI